jgi:signal transduction histidine kinase
MSNSHVILCVDDEPQILEVNEGGTCGQGLAIARTIVVDKHGGRIHVASTAGLGTCFTLRLPVDGSVGVRS